MHAFDIRMLLRFRFDFVMIHRAFFIGSSLLTASATTQDTADLLSIVLAANTSSSELTFCDYIAQAEWNTYPEWLLKHMDGYSKLDMIVGEDNAVLSALSDEDCTFDDVSKCVPGLSVHSSFRISAAAVLVGILGLIWLIFLTPCYFFRCMRCCEARQARNLKVCDYVSIYVFAGLCLVGLLVCVGYGSIKRNEMNRGISYAMCGLQRTSHKVMDKLATQSSGIVPLSESIYGSEYSSFKTELPVIVDAASKAQIYSEQTTALFQDLKTSFLSNSFLFFGAASSPIVSDFSSTNVSVANSIISQLQGNSLNTTLNDASAIITNLTITEETLPYVVEYNAVFGNLVSSTIVKHEDKFQILQKWLREGSLGLFILLFIPVLAVFFAVCVYAPASYSSTFSDPRVRPYRSNLSALCWFMTFGFAFVTMAIAAAAFVLSYNISASCMVGKDMGQNVANFTHLFANFSGPSTSNWASLVEAIVDVDSAVDNLAVGTDPATTLSFRDSILGMVDNLEQFVTLQAVAPEMAYNLTSIAEAFEAQGPITVGNSISLLTDTSILNSLWTYYENHRYDNSTYNMTRDEFMYLYNLTYATSPNCENVTYNPQGLGYSVYNSSIFAAEASLGSLWPTGVVPGLNFTMSEMIKYGALSSNMTCDALRGLNQTTVVEVLAYSGIELSYVMLLVTKLTVLNAEGFRCIYLEVDDLTEALGSQTMTLTNVTCNYTMFIDTLSVKLPQSFRALEENFNAAVDNINLAQWEAYNTTLVESDASQLLYAALGEGVISHSAHDNWVIFLEAGCETAVPGFLMLGVTLFMFGICSIFGVIAQFIVWRRLVDNFALWADVRRAAANVPAV